MQFRCALEGFLSLLAPASGSQRGSQTISLFGRLLERTVGRIREWDRTGCSRGNHRE